MPHRLRIVQVGDVALVAPALADALAPHADVINVPLRHVAANRPGLAKALAAPVRVADAARVARDVRALRPDVVHVHWVPNGVVGLMVGRPWVLHAHGQDIRALNRWRRLAFGPLLRSAGVLVVSTPDLLAHAPRSAELLPTPIPRRTVRATARWDVLVSSAALPVKRSAVAFATLRVIAAERPGLRLAAQDGPAFENGPWERLAGTSKASFQARLASARVVIGQFGVGALGIADLEAMAVGRPVLTWVLDGLYAHPPPVFSSRDPRELAARARALLDSDSEREAAGAAGAEWVRLTHDPDGVAACDGAIARRPV